MTTSLSYVDVMSGTQPTTAVDGIAAGIDGVVQAAAEGHSAFCRIHLKITHQGIVVGGNDHVHVLDGMTEARVPEAKK